MDDFKTEIQERKGFIADLKSDRAAQTDKKQIKTEAEQLEKQRNAARSEANNTSRLGGGISSAVALFQISIALGSISLLTKKKPLYFLSMAIGVASTIKMVLVRVQP